MAELRKTGPDASGFQSKGSWQEGASPPWSPRIAFTPIQWPERLRRPEQSAGEAAGVLYHQQLCVYQQADIYKRQLAE